LGTGSWYGQQGKRHTGPKKDPRFDFEENPQKPKLSQTNYTYFEMIGVAEIPTPVIPPFLATMELNVSYSLPGLPGENDMMHPNISKQIAAFEKWHPDDQPVHIDLHWWIHTVTEENITQVRLTFSHRVKTLRVEQDFDSETISIAAISKATAFLVPKELRDDANRFLGIACTIHTVIRFGVASSHGQVEAEYGVSLGETHRASEAANLVIELEVKDLNAPEPYFPMMWRFGPGLIGLLLLVPTFVICVVYLYLRYWTVLKNVRENNGLPPPFYEGLRIYRGW